MGNDLSRREALRRLAAGMAGTAVAPHAVVADTAGGPPAAAQQPAGVCILTPQAVEGPYYFDPKLERADITEGRPGKPLRLELRVVEASSCKPISKARVDIWHADAGGVYSGYRGQGDARNQSTQGQQYLRGTQFADADGAVRFETVYPGWYPGRTPHIHVKVFVDAKTVLTGQVYFPDELSGRIYAAHPAYVARPKADTTNATDGLFRAGEREGGGTILTIEDGAERVTGRLVIGVDRTGGAARRAEGWGQWLRGLVMRRE